MDDDKEQQTEEAQTPAPEAENDNGKPQPETPADEGGNGGESSADTDRLADIENRLTALESLTSEKFGILDKMREGMAEQMLDGGADDDGTPDGADDDPDGVNMTLDDIFD